MLSRVRFKYLIVFKNYIEGYGGGSNRYKSKTKNRK